VGGKELPPEGEERVDHVQRWIKDVLEQGNG